MSVTEYNRMLQSVTECYRVLQNVTECYRVLQSVTECYRVLQSISSASTWTNFWACFELSYTLLTTHSIGLYEVTKKISAL